MPPDKLNLQVLDKYIDESSRTRSQSVLQRSRTAGAAAASAPSLDYFSSHPTLTAPVITPAFKGGNDPAPAAVGQRAHTRAEALVAPRSSQLLAQPLGRSYLRYDEADVRQRGASAIERVPVPSHLQELMCKATYCMTPAQRRAVADIEKSDQLSRALLKDDLFLRSKQLKHIKHTHPKGAAGFDSPACPNTVLYKAEASAEQQAAQAREQKQQLRLQALSQQTASNVFPTTSEPRQVDSLMQSKRRPDGLPAHMTLCTKERLFSNEYTPPSNRRALFIRNNETRGRSCDVFGNAITHVPPTQTMPDRPSKQHPSLFVAEGGTRAGVRQ